MTRPNDISLDELLFDLQMDGVEPTHANLLALIDLYPQHRDALVAFFAAAGADLESEDDDQPARNVESFVNRGISRALNLMHARAPEPPPHHEPAAEASAAPRLSALARRRGLSTAELAMRVGLDEMIVVKLDRRRIPPRTVPMAAFHGLSQELGVLTVEVISSATGPPIAASAGRLMKAKGPLVLNTETFREAVEKSTMSEDAKAHWLALAPDADAPGP
jgi:hypothetical protein